MNGRTVETLVFLLLVACLATGCALDPGANGADPAAADPATAAAAAAAGANGNNGIPDNLDQLPGTTLVSMMPEQTEDGGNGTDPATGAEAGNPPAPDAPAQSPGPRTDLQPPRGPITKNAELQELKDTYGITVAGNYSDEDIDLLITSARQYRADETKRLTVNFFIGQTNEMGAGGMYTEEPALADPNANGLMEIFDASLHVTLHELTHHIHFHPQNADKGKKIAEETTNAIPGYPDSFQLRFVPSEYALTEKGEFWAEFFTFLRKEEKNLQDQEPAIPAFDPTQDVRVIARKAYAD